MTGVDNGAQEDSAATGQRQPRYLDDSAQTTLGLLRKPGAFATTTGSATALNLTGPKAGFELPLDARSPMPSMPAFLLLSGGASGLWPGGSCQLLTPHASAGISGSCYSTSSSDNSSTITHVAHSCGGGAIEEDYYGGPAGGNTSPPPSASSFFRVPPEAVACHHARDSSSAAGSELSSIDSIDVTAAAFELPVLKPLPHGLSRAVGPTAAAGHAPGGAAWLPLAAASVPAGMPRVGDGDPRQPERPTGSSCFSVQPPHPCFATPPAMGLAAPAAPAEPSSRPSRRSLWPAASPTAAPPAQQPLLAGAEGLLLAAPPPSRALSPILQPPGAAELAFSGYGCAFNPLYTNNTHPTTDGRKIHSDGASPLLHGCYSPHPGGLDGVPRPAAAASGGALSVSPLGMAPASASPVLRRPASSGRARPGAGMPRGAGSMERAYAEMRQQLLEVELECEALRSRQEVRDGVVATTQLRPAHQGRGGVGGGDAVAGQAPALRQQAGCSVVIHWARPTSPPKA